MNRPILHLIPHLSGGGMERRMAIIAKYSSLKLPVYIAFLSEGLNKKDIDLQSIKKYKIDSKSNYDYRILIKLIILIIKIRPKVIQTWSIQMDILGGILCIIFRINHIMMEPISPEANSRGIFDLKFFIKSLVAKNSIVISNSKNGMYFWKKKNVKKSLLIRNGFDLKKIQNSKEKFPSKLEKFLNNSKFIVTASRLSITSLHKQNDLILKTFSMIVKKDPSLKLVICGGGPYESFYKELAVSYKLESNVFFTGFLKREQLWAVFHRALLFISLSKFEGMPNSVVEAALCKTPLFISRIETHLEVIPEDLAYFAYNSDPNLLSEEIIKVINKSKKSLTNSSLLFDYLKKFSLEAMMNKYMRLYKFIYGKN